MTKECDASKREDERKLTVIDTPGIMDTVAVFKTERIEEMITSLSESHKVILRELAKVFVMSPKGLDAIIITLNYGGRFGLEDAEALKILRSFFGTEALAYMILILTHGDQAARNAKEKDVNIEDEKKSYIATLPLWVLQFVKEIGERTMLFDNTLDPRKKPDECKKQVSKLLQVKVHFERKMYRASRCRSAVA